MSKKFIAGIFAVATFAIASVSFAAYDFGTTTLKVGSRGEAVKAVQTVVGATPADGIFGNITKAKVMVWQAANGLTADGLFGNASKAKANGGAVVVTPGTPSTGSTTLKGGAGDLQESSTSTDVEDNMKEGEEGVNVLGLKLEADGSDIAVTSMKVLFSQIDSADSEDISDYLEKVYIYQGSKEVGSADASDFSRDSGSPDIYTKTISLSNAVVEEGDKDAFYVVVDVASSLDSSDVDSADLLFTVDTVRYTDGTGAIMSINDLAGTSDVLDDSSYDNKVTLKDVATDDDLNIKSSSANPVSSTLTVDKDTDSDEILVGAFKFEVDEDSSDITINDFNIDLTMAAGGVTADTADTVIDTLMVKIDGDEFEADLGTDGIENGSGTAEYTVSFDDEEMVIEAGDTVEVKLYATFNDQEGNYATGTTVKFESDGADVDAEGEDDMDADGDFAGKTHTLSVSAPVFSLVSKSLALSQAIDGVSTGEEDVFLAKFVFEVTAGDEDVYLPKATYTNEAYTTDANGDTTIVDFTQLAAGAINSVVFDADDESIDDNTTSSFLVSSGDTEKFTLSFYIEGADASEKITIDSFAYGFDDDTTGDTSAGGTNYTYAETVSSGISTFATSTVYLAK